MDKDKLQTIIKIQSTIIEKIQSNELAYLELVYEYLELKVEELYHQSNKECADKKELLLEIIGDIFKSKNAFMEWKYIRAELILMSARSITKELINSV